VPSAPALASTLPSLEVGPACCRQLVVVQAQIGRWLAPVALRGHFRGSGLVVFQQARDGQLVQARHRWPVPAHEATTPASAGSLWLDWPQNSEQREREGGAGTPPQWQRPERSLLTQGQIVVNLR